MTTRKRTREPGQRGGNTYTLSQLAAACKRFLPFAPRAGVVWGLRAIDPRLREEIMLTVAQANGCRYCSYVHQEWAIRTGAPDDEIAQLEGTDPADFDRAKWSALVYARSLTERDFGQVPTDIVDDVSKHHSPSMLRNIEAVTMAMTIVNRSANTADALLSRLRGAPASESLLAELVITAGLLTIGPIIVPALCLILRKSPGRLLRDLRSLMAGTPTSG